MRDINALHPEMKQKLYDFKKLCRKKGLEVGIGECLRTAAEQDALYAQGRTKPGPKVTNAKGSSYSSQHQWGIAADFYRNDGTGAFNTSGNFFEKAGEIAKSLGLGWGGDWKSPVDRPHLYLPQWGSTTARLKSRFGTPEKFMKTWVKCPVFETGQSYVTTQACYLRKSPGTGDNKVDYASLSEAVKKKCRQKSGYAIFKKEKNFRLVKVKTVSGNVWGQMKSGYWVPLMHKGEIRAEK